MCHSAEPTTGRSMLEGAVVTDPADGRSPAEEPHSGVAKGPGGQGSSGVQGTAVHGRLARPCGFALTDPDVRLSRTRLGQLDLRVTKLRPGSAFPPFLKARKTTDKALISVIQEAWIAGVSTRKVDDPAQAPPGVS